MHPIITRDPVSGNELIVTRLESPQSGIVIEGQITALQAAQLLDTILPEYERTSGQIENRTVRIWMTDMSTNRRKMNMTATIPVYLVSMSLRLLARLLSQLNDGTLQHMIRAIE